MDIFNTEQPMANLSLQQQQEAEQLFSRALQCAKNNDSIGAAEYYQKAAAHRHPGAQNNLGNMYKAGRGVNRDPQKAFELFLDAATHSNIVAMRNLATCYQEGVGTDADFYAAVAWLMTAVEQRDNLACAMLAKAYDGWQHKDEEKKIYWHKKAAEYGNADSMFFLGDYYGKPGNNQDYDQAINYYESAAKVGKPEMKLKVAKALDMPTYGEKVALNLERAKYWYTEAINGDNDSVKLDAAKGLDVLCSYDGELIRPALDSIKAFMTYRALMNRNKEACALAAYCSEMGRGTNQCIDIAIMLYERAGYKDRAEWCKKKKSGDLSDHAYEQHIEYSMPIVVKNVHSHGKELYRSNIDSRICEYDEKIYYIKSSYGHPAYLCSSDLSGNDIKIVTEVSEDFDYSNIHVNTTGIYLYYLRDGDRLLIQHISFDGKKIGECREEYDGGYEEGHSVSNVYFYDNKAYYVYEYHMDDDSKSQIKCMYVDEGRTDVIYEKANSVERLFATEEKLIFSARYENDDCEESWADGWMILDLLWGTIECLSNPYCSPENVIDDPDIYYEENPRYNDKYNYDRKIVSFDLNRGIFWAERTSMEGEDSAHLKPIKYWEPKSLWGDRDEVISDLPIWKITGESRAGREYFDGIYHYYSESYHVFKSSDVYGNTYEWSVGNGGHGVCDNFKVIGDYLFLNVAAYDEEQYELSVRKVEPIRKSWFEKELPEEVIALYQNGEKNTSDSSMKKSVEKSDDFSFGFELQVIEEQEVSLIEPDELPTEVEDEEPDRDCSCFEDKAETSDKRNPLKLYDLRASVDKFVGAKQSLIDFRKSLPEKWDYNAFVGILMSVKGPKHADIACMNMAIGQGDNFKSTETRLEAMGLIDLFNKYKGKKYDQNVTVEEVEDEIIAIAPKYKTIRDFFDKVVVTQMSNRNYEVPSNIVKLSVNKNTTTNREGTDQDLYVDKKIGDTDVKYNICTFGSKFHIGFGVPVTIQINGNTYQCKTHNTAKGRIDGMKKLYAENNIALGDVLKATYSAEDKAIRIEKI